MGNLCPVKVVSSSETTAQAPKLGKEARQAVLDNILDHLTASQLRQVTKLLDVFSENKFDMGRTHLVKHTIDTRAHRPNRQGIRRHPRAHLDIIDEQVDDLQRNDFVEPAASSWASNVVLVKKKKDGLDRLCVDYRAVNSVTYKYTYPLPHIDSSLESMYGAVWFTTLDLRSGYHNIPIKEEDRDKTAFITKVTKWTTIEVAVGPVWNPPLPFRNTEIQSTGKGQCGTKDPVSRLGTPNVIAEHREQWADPQHGWCRVAGTDDEPGEEP